MKIQVMVFQIVMPCSDVEKDKATRSSKMLISCYITTWCHNPEDHNLNMIYDLNAVVILRYWYY
jgi:hypothetical protein